MNVNEALKGLIDRIEGFDRPEDPHKTEGLIKMVQSLDGTSPSLEMLQSAVKFFSDDRLAVVRDDIPSVLSEYGLQSAVMADGTRVTVDLFYETKQVDKAKVAEWLERNGYGSIIKDTLALEKGQFDEMLEKFLEEGGYSYSKDSNVNGMSLKAVVRKHVEDGGEYPPVDTIDLKIIPQAKVTKPKGEF